MKRTQVHVYHDTDACTHMDIHVSTKTVYKYIYIHTYVCRYMYMYVLYIRYLYKNYRKIGFDAKLVY